MGVANVVDQIGLLVWWNGIAELRWDLSSYFNCSVVDVFTFEAES
jgi:hypothetical protein